jgi:hypothetical protein
MLTNSIWDRFVWMGIALAGVAAVDRPGDPPAQGVGDDPDHGHSDERDHMARARGARPVGAFR